MTALLRYLSGYVCVELTGYATERFLNLCTNHDINLWTWIIKKILIPFV